MMHSFITMPFIAGFRYLCLNGVGWEANADYAATSGLSALVCALWLGTSAFVATWFAAASAALGGLVAITPASGFVGPMPALPIGFIAGIFCLWMVTGVFPARLNNVGAALVIVLAVSGTAAILKFCDLTLGLRPLPDDEEQGLDLNRHGEEGYGTEA